MSEQAHWWSQAASDYERDFIDPAHPGVHNPLLPALAELAGAEKTAADLGCGIGPLLPLLAGQFRQVIAVDFAAGMLKRARERCHGLANVAFAERGLTDLEPLRETVDVAVAVNSLVLPDLGDLEAALRSIRSILRPGGQFLGIVPAMDAVHYFTMLLLDRARQTGMPESKARQNAAHYGEHETYDFAFGEFRFQGLRQHFWQAFEVPYRLRRAGFRLLRQEKVLLTWDQFGIARDLIHEAPPWDWFFHADVAS